MMFVGRILMAAGLVLLSALHIPVPYLSALVLDDASASYFQANFYTCCRLQGTLGTSIGFGEGQCSQIMGALGACLLGSGLCVLLFNRVATHILAASSNLTLT